MSSETPQWSRWEWSTHWNCYERRVWDYSTNDWIFDYDTVTPAPHVPRHTDDALAASFGSRLSFNSPHDDMRDTTGPTSRDYPPTAMQRQHSGSAGARDDTIHFTKIRPQNLTRKLEKSYPKFMIHHSSHWGFGRILKILWSEPEGSGGTQITVMAGHGKTSHCKYRRFVIIDTRKGHSICLPILTHGGQGTLKPGAHPEDHAVIYSTKRPTFMAGERITKESIKCEMEGPDHKLDPASRLNYAKVYTIEHNVKVLFIGGVAKNYGQKVVADYNRTHPGLVYRPEVLDEAPADTTSYAEGVEPSYTTDAPTQGDFEDWQPTAEQDEDEEHAPDVPGQGEQFDDELYAADVPGQNEQFDDELYAADD